MKKGIIYILILCLLFLQCGLLTSCDPATGKSPSQSSDSNTTADISLQDSPQAFNGIKNIILIIGDGMGATHINAGMKTEGKTYPFTEWQKIKVDTHSLDQNGKATVVTDSAASGTAMATGKLTVNDYVGKSPSGKNLSTIMDLAKKQNKSTGIVTTEHLCGATPGAFSSHSFQRYDFDTVLRTQLYSDIDLLCGNIDWRYTAKRAAFESAGYTYCDTYSDISNTMQASKVLWQFNLATPNEEIPLKDVSIRALDFLDRNEAGFVLMIEQAHIDIHSHENDFEGMVKSVHSLNDTVEAVMGWIGDRTDTVVLVTADHECGGLIVSAKPDKNTQTYSASYESSNGAVACDIYYRWLSTVHTGARVNMYVWGAVPDLSKYSSFPSGDIIKNSSIFDLMRDLLVNTEGTP